MPRPRALLLSLGSVGLVASALLGLRAAWPAPRGSVQVTIDPSTPAATAGRASETPATASAPMPGFTLQLDMPSAMLSGRGERLHLTLDVPARSEDWIVYAEIVSVGLEARPPGASGQPLQPGASFGWTVTARRGPDVSATVVLRVRSAIEGSLPLERLLLARDVRLPVHKAFGLSFPVAIWTAATLACAGVAALLAAARRRAG